MRGVLLLVVAIVGTGCSFDSGGSVGKDAGDVPDAGVDAAVVACTRDQECETPPDLCHLSGLCNPSTQRCEFPLKDCSSAGDQCNTGTCEAATGDCVPTPAFEGDDCGAGTSCGSYGACGGFDDICDETGTQSRDCIDHKCSSGACIAVDRVDPRDCTRDQTGEECSATTCGSFGSCMDFSDTCDEHGTHYRDCTSFACAAGSCVGTIEEDSGPCTRASRDGLMCAPDSCGSFGACVGFSDVCDETGERTQTCTRFRCNSEACSAASTYPNSVGCTRSTDGTKCDEACDEVCSGSGDCATMCMGSCTTVCSDVLCSEGVCGG